MSTKNLISELMEAFRCLPSVGPKSAQRMTYHLLERNREGARHLAQTLLLALERVGHCQQCRTLSEAELCHLCAHPRRDRHTLCIVETPVDVHALEQAGTFSGLYFVLMGRLSPLDGIGPQEIGLDRLGVRLDEGEITEVILATNATVEGETTAHYIAEMARRRHIKTTRLAQGVPMGGELEFIDGGTLAHALSGRREI
ncbi:MAG: recombination protein RecR [Halothiobacillaceae bacterium]|nr:MAG: recombination protein RecR [Halothiobacillaceae bacterium]